MRSRPTTKSFRIGLAAALMVLLFPMSSQAGLIITLQKYDGFSFVTVGSASDATDATPNDGGLTNFYSSAQGSFITSAHSAAPTFGYLTETNINFSIAAGTLWKLIVADDGYILGNGNTMFRTGVTTNPLSNLDVSVTTKVDSQVVFSGALPQTNAPAVYEVMKRVDLSEPTDIVHEIIFGNSSSTIGYSTISVTTEDIPEPTTLGLLGVALLGLGFFGRKVYGKAAFPS